MLIKKVAFVFVFLSCFLVLVCCNEKMESKGSALSIYLFDNDNNIQNAVDKFNKQNKNLMIKVEMFQTDQKKELAERIQDELLSGQGPDLVLLEPDMLPELSKYINKNVFFDINESIKKDKKFDLTGYNSKVLNCGVYNDKRFVIPLFYNVNAFFTTEEALKKNNISLDGGVLSIEEIDDISEDYIKSIEAGKYFFSPLDFSYFLSQGKFIDFLQNKAGFEKLLNLYKELYDKSVKNKSYADYKGSGDSGLLKDNVTVMNLNEISSFKLAWERYAMLDENATPKVSAIAFNKSAPQCYVHLVKSIAINANSTNKEGAFRFIKLLLSEEFQENANVLNFPVNNNAFEKQKEIFLKGTGEENNIIPLRGGCLNSDQDAQKVTSDIEKIIGFGNCNIIDNKILEIINSNMEDYLAGKSNTRSTYDKIKKDIDNYLKTPLPKPEKKDVQAVSEKPKVVLKLSYMYYNSIMKNAQRIFKDKYKDVEVKSDVCRKDDYSGFQEYINNLKISIMSGEGPDVIVFDRQTFSNLDKVVSSGVFVDLNEFIESDTKFKIEDYFENLLKVGVYGGKRYYIPISVSFDFLLTTEEKLAKYGLQYDKTTWTWDRFAESGISRFSNKNDEVKLSYDFRIETILNNCEKYFINYRDKSTSFNSPEFIKLLNIYKRMMPLLAAQDKERQDEDNNQVLKSCVITPCSSILIYNYLNNICYYISQISQYSGETVKILPMPSYEGGENSYAIPQSSIAINSNSKVKQSAFDFIKIVLSKDMQTIYNNYTGNYNDLFALPVNKEAYEEDVGIYSSDKVSDYFPSQVKPIPLSPKITSAINSIVKNAQVRLYYDTSVLDIIDEEVSALLEGTKTAEEVAKIIDNKVALILNE